METESNDNNEGKSIILQLRLPLNKIRNPKIGDEAEKSAYTESKSFPNLSELERCRGNDPFIFNLFKKQSSSIENWLNEKKFHSQKPILPNFLPNLSEIKTSAEFESYLPELQQSCAFR